eukprot:gene35763-48090_t
MTGQDGFKEFIWAEPVRHTDDEVIARLANEPQHLRGLTLGSEVRVKKDLIFDWGYEKGGKLYGHFTTRVLMNKFTPEERAEVEGRFSPMPLEPEAQAARDLERMARERLAAEGLLPEALTAFAGARRLTLVAEGLPEAQRDRHEEVKGPRTNAPEQALDGFLRKTGLTKGDLTERDGVWYADLHKPGRPTPEIVAELAEAAGAPGGELVLRYHWLPGLVASNGAVVEPAPSLPGFPPFIR